jgi:hypothetical protein
LSEDIAHQNPSRNPPACFFTGLRQGFQKKVSVVVIQIDGIAAISPRHQMVKTTG